jgi:hypothetical protein
MHRWLLIITLAFWARLAGAPMPAELEQALKAFHAEGSKGWAFTQTTIAGGKSLIERFDPSKPETTRWSLVQKDGHAATAEEKQKYQETLTRRSRGDTAPNVKDQINPDTCEVVGTDGDRTQYRFRLKPGGDDDKSAEHMAATFTLHRPSGTIERVELASIEPFSPVFLIKIEEARTVMTYSLPEKERPTLLQKVTVRVRGRAMWFKSLDEDMTVSYSDYALAQKKPPRPLPDQP